VQKNCVTGSCHLIQAAGVNLLVDSGIAQGQDPVLPFDQWPVPPAAVDNLFLTHYFLIVIRKNGKPNNR
jgi:metallo-beta-lactamase family protein